MTDSVLLISPSCGLGGGIERYVSTIEAAFDAHAVPYRRLSLREPGRSYTRTDRLRFVRDVAVAARAAAPVRLVLAHRNLLPVVPVAARVASVREATVIVHGRDIWTNRTRGRRLLRRPGIRVVAASNFSAGALSDVCAASVLPPGLAAPWYERLVAAAEVPRPLHSHREVVTAFRLVDWRDKGLATLLDALRLLADDRVRLTICGRGPVPDDLADAVAPHPWCTVVPDPTDEDLARRMAAADVFVLATRTRYGSRPSGEGFGLVLLEAQVAGAPVVAPAYGGSGDAFQPGLTGVAPRDESPHALAAALHPLLTDDALRRTMGRSAATWARDRFAPDRHSRRVVNALLGGDIA